MTKAEKFLKELSEYREAIMIDFGEVIKDEDGNDVYYRVPWSLDTNLVKYDKEDKGSISSLHIQWNIENLPSVDVFNGCLDYIEGLCKKHKLGYVTPTTHTIAHQFRHQRVGEGIIPYFFEYEIPDIGEDNMKAPFITCIDAIDLRFYKSSADFICDAVSYFYLRDLKIVHTPKKGADPKKTRVYVSMERLIYRYQQNSQNKYLADIIKSMPE